MKNNIKMDFREIGLGTGFIWLRIQTKRWALVKMPMKLVSIE
jgi:hypothetical protein